MLFFIITLMCLSGASLAYLVGRDTLNRVEIVGLSFPLGLLIAVSGLMLPDTLHLKLSPAWVISLLSLVLVVSLMLLCRRGAFTALLPQKGSTKRWFSQLNVVWLIFFALIMVIEVMNFRKCMFFPTFDRDSLAGFDTLGYLIAQERTVLGLSVFTPMDNPLIHDAGSYISYAPLVQLSYALVYMLGAETSKLIPALLFLFFLIAFYGSLRDRIGKTGAIIATAFVLITPEMVAFSSLSATNVIHAIYASLGVIYALKSIPERESPVRTELLWISALLLLASLLTRYDGIVFPIAMGLYLLYYALRKQIRWVQLVAWSAIVIVPVACWLLHQRVTGMVAESITIKTLFWDGPKASFIATGLWSHLTSTQLYGWSFLILLISLVASIPIIIRHKRWRALWHVVIGFVIPLLLYGLLLYHINYSWDSIDNVVAYSAKRYLFCFVPIALFIAFTLDAFRLMSCKVEKWLS